MTQILQSIKDFFAPKEPLPAGFYTYQTPPEAEDQYKLYLRIEADGTGILIINAATILHLNKTAVEFAYHYMHGLNESRVVELVSNRYNVSPQQVQMDYQEFLEKILTLIYTPDLDPVTYLDLERQEPYSDDISAPYRLDCALTYRIDEGVYSSDTPGDRVDRELSTEEWKTIIEKAFKVGIPHLLFTGGEPTLREDLSELIEKAEHLGMVTGLLTNGLKLADDSYRNLLLSSGLDHLMIVLDPDNLDQWKILEKTFAEDCFTTVHLTLREGQNLQPHILRLAEMGANALSLSTADEGLADELQRSRDTAAMQQLELVWDLPVPYSQNNPVALELEKLDNQTAPEGAGKAWLYVEPDGDVLPAQGLYGQILGNLLTDPWEKIWSKG